MTALPATTSAWDELATYRALHYEAALSSGEFLDRCRAALDVTPRGSYLSHHTAGRLLGLWVPASARIHVSIPGNGRRQVPDGIAAHRGHLDAERVRVGGCAVSSPAQVVLDLQRFASVVELTHVVDSVLALGRCTPDELTSYVFDRGTPFARLRHALRLADGRAESAGETRTRLLLHFGGLPAPTSQWWVVAAGFRYRLDLAYPQWRIAVEYDGRHHDEPRQAAEDAARRARLREHGWVVIVVRGEDLYYRPGEVLADVAAAVSTRSGVEVRPSAAWRSHFADHAGH